MLDRRTEGFPLFPLGIVALPTEAVPLHIFEDRYKRMIEECLLADLGSVEREFGIVWLSDEELKPVGCACAIERVLDRDEDGSMDILTRGTAPFRLIERRDDLPYPAGIVEPLADVDEEADPDAARATRESYGELVEQATDRQLSEDELAELDAYAMAARSSSASTPSRNCSSCARRTRACACSRSCSEPRSSAWSSSTAPRRAPAPTARSASAEPYAPG